MHYNIDFNIAALTILAIYYFYLKIIYTVDSYSNILFRRIIVWVFLTTLFDTLSVITNTFSAKVPLWLNYLTHTAFFISAVVASFIFEGYIRYVIFEKKMKIIDAIGHIVLVAYATLVITNPYTHYVFSFDEAKAYMHGPLHFLLYIIPLFFVSLALGRVIKHQNRFRTKTLWSLSVFTVLVIITVLVQFLFFEEVLLAFFGTTLATMVLFFSLETPDYHHLVKTLGELEEAKKEAEEARAAAYAANQAKSNFLANMSHEIRTPINGILGMNAIALRDNKDPDIEECLANIQDAGQNLLNIVNEILDFSKAESGKMEIVESDYELGSILYSVYNLMNNKALDKNLKFVINNDPDIPGRLYGDGQRVQQIIINLVNNGIKYTKEGGVTLDISYNETITGIDLIIRVRDTGIGISEENLRNLFKPFERVDLKKNRTIEGTGLGLMITKSLVELMGGIVDVASTLGEGSCFSIILPQKVISSEPMGVFNPSAKRTVPKVTEDVFSAPTGEILIVDDVLVNLKVVSGLLKKTGLKIDTATGGIQCLAMAHDKKYDIIYLDHMMPEMDGIETLKLLRSQEGPNKETPVIVLTANAIRGVREEYMAQGFDDYLSKPINRNELLESVRLYLPPEKIEV